MVDRNTAHITKLTLPNFDAFYSLASWYRDLVAYCGVSDNGTRLYAMVARSGVASLLLQKALGAPAGGDLPDAECGEPQWQRQPTRVTFAPTNKDKVSFSIRSSPKRSRWTTVMMTAASRKQHSAASIQPSMVRTSKIQVDEVAG